MSGELGWSARAQLLAEHVCGPGSRWSEPVATVPRHVFVPHWWTRSKPGGEWVVTNGEDDELAWLEAAYSDSSLVTSVDGHHADHATSEPATGRPTSSSTMPGLVVQMLRHARLHGVNDILEVGTGSGYGAALLARRFGDERVTSVDVDPYLIGAADARLDRVGLRPTVRTCDATGQLPGGAERFDRIVSTVSVRPIPPSWLVALRPGGRLVTTITGMSVVLTAERNEDGGATGRIEHDRAMFMPTREEMAGAQRTRELLDQAEGAEGEQVSQGRHPVVDVVGAWELRSMLELEVPGTDARHSGRAGAPQRLLLAHPDGSWARAAMREWEPPVVHQSGPRRLWDALDQVRDYWLRLGYLPLHGARVTIDPDGTVHLGRGGWTDTIGSTEE